jgi:putative proteasome-type protease
MTYCLGILLREGLVLASDSRSNAGYDQVNVCRKMHIFEQPGERLFVVLTSGSLSLSQSVLTLLRAEWEQGEGLAKAESMYEAARVLGDRIRRVSEIDRAALEKDDFRFNTHLILGGQIAGQKHNLYLIYPQGNPLCAAEETPYLQVGETKYGRPILDRGVHYEYTTLEQAAKYALISLDSTIRSNLTVGPPIDLLVYPADTLRVTRHRRFSSRDPDLLGIHTQWEQALRRAVLELPAIRFEGDPKP